jgi:hypothetical protein
MKDTQALPLPEEKAPIGPGHYRQVKAQKRIGLRRVTENKKAAAIRGLCPELGEVKRASYLSECLSL